VGATNSGGINSGWTTGGGINGEEEQNEETDSKGECIAVYKCW
jgi:hypothetical protein